MNLDEAATFLRIGRPTLNRWIRQGLLADAGLRGGWIDDAVLAAWARRRGIDVQGKHTDREATPTDLFAEAITAGAVTTGAAIDDAMGAIEAAVAALDLTHDVHATVLQETLARERLAGTGLGGGVAIPHPRRPRGEWTDAPRVSVVYLDPALDWAAIDGRAVHAAILILSPSTRLHLQLLSRIAFALRSPGFGELLIGQPSCEELAEHVQRITRDR